MKHVINPQCVIATGFMWGALIFYCAVMPAAFAAEPPVERTLAAWRSAIAADDLDQLKTLLNRSPDTGLLDVVAPNGKNVLMVAAKRGDTGFVRLLFAAGVDIKTRTITRGNALMFAALGGHVDVAQFLVARGVALNAQGDNGWSALTIAVAKGHERLLRWLIQQGADFNAPDIYQWTPLMRAINNDQEGSVSILLATPGIALDAQDEAGNTALHHAVMMKNETLVARLVEMGADTQLVNAGNHLPRQLLPSDGTHQTLLRWLQP